MKVLLDENLPHELRHHLVGHDVFTVAYLGWSGTKNGALLERAAREGFEAFVTMDNGVAYQQNVAALSIGVVILSAASNDMSDLLPLVPALLRSLATLKPRMITRVP
jgi:hypothetical protein